jgi:hypothetical protein
MTKQISNSIPSGTMEEYAELREEIRTYLSRREQSKNFVFMITLAIIGLDASSLVKFADILFPVCALLIWFIWFDELGRIRAVFRVATYIEIFIESKVPGLRWETNGSKHPIQTRLIRRILSNAEFPVLLLVFVWFSWSRLNISHPFIAYSFAIVSLLMTISLSIVSIYVSRKGRNLEKAKWIAIQADQTREEKAANHKVES